tara:strand:- start:329 stop:541 length:213 start_codon:yes stop_codon:yes gene_type:complete
MRNSRSSNIDYQNKINQKFSIANKEIKTTNVNILLNRVRQENKNDKKKKIILSISLISFISLVSILVFGN